MSVCFYMGWLFLYGTSIWIVFVAVNTWALAFYLPCCIP